ncbi:60S ribosomal protein L6 [Rhodotorula diobovata]|uniref:60S ribosomal protein L6 n=1 Tax=Rhodotorula diobovata TaxID=5288 RepID=A0A5C5G1P9_9BASI|nr:60S ribosomal protein L6 [Rhodotorula diobovata]
MARNSDVSPYIGKLSRSKLYSKKGLYKREHKAAAPSDKAEAKEETAYYPADDVRKPKASRKSLKPTKLRASITPGTVLILLAGRFRGKRVVCLGQLPSGLLLVTGPFKVNGVPLRRVNQAYVIATSTKVDLSSFQLDAKFDDAYFSKDKSSSRQAKEGDFFKDGESDKKKAFPADKAADQKSVDKAILAAVAQTPNLTKYLGATFGLSKGQFPHLLKF